MPHLPPDIQYILDTSVEIGENTKADFMYFLQRTDLDVINIFDTETNPIKILMNEYDKWFQNLSDIEKVFEQVSSLNVVKNTESQYTVKKALNKASKIIKSNAVCVQPTCGG